MQPQLILEARFLTTEEGGRQRSIIGEKYGCPIMVGEQSFDCRFVIDNEINLSLGETHMIPVRLLDPNIALHFLTPGTEISLWEGKTIAVGKVLNVPVDIFQKIEHDFGENANAIHESLKIFDANSKNMIGNRLIRSIIFLAKGDAALFHEKIKLAQTDWRDVLMQAEYSYPVDVRVRDFDKTFYELGLLEGNDSIYVTKTDK